MVKLKNLLVTELKQMADFEMNILIGEKFRLMLKPFQIIFLGLMTIVSLLFGTWLGLNAPYLIYPFTVLLMFFWFYL